MEIKPISKIDKIIEILWWGVVVVMSLPLMAAGIFALIGFSMGIFISITTAIILTILIVVGVITLFWYMEKNSSKGHSNPGDSGLSFVGTLGILSFCIPMWFTTLIAALVRAI